MVNLRRPAIVAAIVIVLGVVTTLWLTAPTFIAEAYHGRSIRLLNGVISGQQRHSVADYVALFRRTLVSLSATLGILVALSVFIRPLAARVQALTPRLRAGLLLGLILLVAAGRLFTFGEAFDRDITAYAVIGEEMLNGKVLYTEVWDHKPPAIHLSYVASLAIFGETPLAIWVLGCGAAILTLLGCYHAARSAGGPVAGMTAAAVWLLINGDLLLQANQPNTEVFMNVCLVWGVVLFSDVRGGLGRAVAAGLLFFLASLYKPVVAAVGVVVVAAYVLTSARDSRTREGRMTMPWPDVRRAVVAGGMAAVAWAGVCGFFMARGTWGQFYEATVAYNRDYAGSMSSNLVSSLWPSSHPLWATLPYLVMTAILVLALLRLVFRTDSQRWALYLCAYFAGAWLAVVMPGRLYPHYYQLLLPPLTIAFGWLVSVALQSRSFLLSTALIAGLFGPLAFRVYQSVVPVSEVPVLKYGAHGVESLEVQRMGDWIRSRLAPSAVLYHWGAEPGVYFWSGRQSPVPFTYNLPLLDGTERGRRYTAQALAMLQQRPPDLIVAKRLDMGRVDHPITQWIRAHYSEIDGPAGISRYVFLVPRVASTVSSGLGRREPT